MDPQQRLLLEVAYEGLENAGLRTSDLAGSDMACYMGSFSHDYENVSSRDPVDKPLYTATGNGSSILSNRISWHFDLRGPSLTLDTACSSSLVALHLACEAIRSKSNATRTAIAGGCALMLGPETPISLSALHFLSPDSRSYSFDERGNGYARGEGVGIVVLKHIDDAIRDGDTIRAIIRGTAVNQDGKTSGITLPSSEAQSRLIRSTYDAAGLSLNDTSYFEAHGTGTAAGDPLEARAIGSTFGADPDRTGPITIGSVKSNIGHLEGAAGVAGLIKSILSLESGLILPQHDFRKPNPKIDLAGWKLQIPTKVTPWPTSELRRISINSFGYGGTNAHAIVDDALSYLRDKALSGSHNTVEIASSPSPDRTFQDSAINTSYDENFEQQQDYFSVERSQHKRIFALMSPEQGAIARMTTTLGSYLDKTAIMGERSAEKHLDDLAYTLSTRRSAFHWRSFAVASTASELKTALESASKSTYRANKVPRQLWVFTGQGAQWARMGAGLLQYEVFADAIGSAERLLQSIGATWSVTTELLAPAGTTRINEPEFSQPLCTVIQVAMVQLLRHWGLAPSAVIGHSSGEIAAAYAAGALSADDAFKVAYHRGRLSQKLKKLLGEHKGAMLSVGLSPEEAHERLAALPSGAVAVVACENSPTNVTISGDRDVLETLEKDFHASGLFSRMLKVTNAYHSPHMEVIAAEYLESLSDIAPLKTDGPKMISTVTGNVVSGTEIGAEYWVRNMTQPVKFVGALDQLFPTSNGQQRQRRKKVDTIDSVLEIGPHGALQGAVKQCLTKASQTDRVSVSSVLSRGQDATATTLATIAKLWATGCSIDLATVNSTERLPKAAKVLVDLPSYAWNHSRQYWHETSQSRHYHQPICGRLDYAGRPVEDFIHAQPLFKNLLRVAELPWLVDHKVQGDIIFPAAGMICAAVEAARQLLDKTKSTLGVELRDICIGQALIIPSDDSGVETFLQLRPRKTGMRSTSSSWQEWNFYTESRQNEITEHASGLLSFVHSHASELENGEEAESLLRNQQNLYEASTAKCTTTLSKEQHYSTMEDIGISYGPTFQGVGSIVSGPSIACTTITVADTKSVMPSNVETESIVHPAVLDAIFQTSFPAYVGVATDMKEAMVPTMIENVFIPYDMPRAAGDSFVTLTEASKRGYRGMTANMIAANSSWRSASLTVNGLILTAVGSLSGDAIDTGLTTAVESQICSEVALRPDLSFLDAENAPELLRKHVEPFEALRKYQVDSSKAAAIWAKRTLPLLPTVMTSATAPHFSHYCKYLEEVYSNAKTRKHPYQGGTEDWLDMDQTAEDQFLATFGAKNPNDGLLLNCIGQNLSAIISGEVQALSVMLEDDMLSKSYSAAHGFASGTAIFQNWFDLAGHKQPSMKVLEIGAGTGGSSLPVLNILGGRNGSPRRFESYTFTDVSSGFFEKAQDLLREWGSAVEFKKLDIENNPEEQGFELGSFDVIAASNVLHATRDLNNTLKNCLKLLKPGGRLILGECAPQRDHASFIYGVLPGWWLSEDGRTGGPLLEQQQWDTVLRDAGFTGVDYSAGDCVDPAYRVFTAMVSTKPVEASYPQPEVTIVVSSRSKTQLMLAESLASKLALLGLKASVLPLQQTVEQSTGRMVISLCEISAKLVSNMSSDDFAQVKNLILKSSRLLWVTSPTASHDPDTAMVSGLLRVAMNEDDALRLHELHLESDVETRLDQTVQHIMKAFAANFTASVDLGEGEMTEVDGLIHVPRYVESARANNHLQALHAKPKPELQPLLQPGRPLKLVVGSPGLLDTLHFVDDKRYYEPLAAEDVEIQVHSNALNFLDIMVAMGKIPDEQLGVDVAGVISRVGPAVTRLKAGDRVYCCGLTGFCANFARIHQSAPHIIPEGMTMEHACSIPAVFMTAYACLYDVGRLEKGESVLIHAAAGGLGQALIQLAKHIGAEIYVTVGTQAKKQLMLDLGIAEDHIFSSRGLSFAQGVMRMTSGRGVDVVVNSLAGEALRKSWECVADFGRFVEVGKVDIYGNTGVEMMPFLQNRSFMGFNLEHLARVNIPKTAKLAENVHTLLLEGAITPVEPVKVFDYSAMEAAFRTLQQGRHTGKLVLKISADSKVQALPKPATPVALDPNATYVLAGGLGGLGRSQAVYMAKHGARHLIFLSRSGAAKEEAIQTLRELRSMGVKAEALACDIADLDQLRTSISSVSKIFPPIKGLVQGAMVLSDKLLDTMTHEQWLTATRPKVDGTWNLHKVLPKDMDFFIMLSSCSGILGGRSQANYAAGNTFQDAFAVYRRSLGLKAQSIDLGITTGVGWVEENARHDEKNHLNRMSAIHVKAEYFMSIFGRAMAGHFGSGHDANSGEKSNMLPAQLQMGAGSGGLERLNTVGGMGGEFEWLRKFARFSYLAALDAREDGSAGPLGGDSGGLEALKQQLGAATSITQAAELCQEALVTKLAKSIMISASDVDTSKPLHHFGVDSLVAVEVRNFITRELKSEVSVFEILANNPISQLSASIAAKSRLLPKELLGGGAVTEEEAA
jgi:acyl transferase domain-containing protein/D-arabinose 1-dehydrogenase-like Zn-dependent alcohol dehydrogenase/SAM-dependent methyltransferase/NADP-dependent 3-hydroxy acid dehydrogenase YdfG